MPRSLKSRRFDVFFVEHILLCIIKLYSYTGHPFDSYIGGRLVHAALDIGHGIQTDDGNIQSKETDLLNL